MNGEQLTLFGPPDLYVPFHDKAVISAKSEYHERAKVSGHFSLNGKRASLKQYPEFNALKSVHDFITIDLKDLPTARASCPVCRQELYRRIEEHNPPGFDYYEDAEELFVRTQLEYCFRCTFWQFHELRSSLICNRGYLADVHDLITIASKLRTFDEAPPDALCEIAQWFRQHPDLYHSVDPTYLEKLVGRIFAASGHYSEVTHVGRPDDGGIDLVLVDDGESTWLVQVKRRESAKASESVQTIRNLLGAMVLSDSKAGIVVSTADHFTQRALEASSRAGSKGYRVDLIDKHALDLMLSQNLLYAPWKNISAGIKSDRDEWFRENIAMLGL